MSRLIFDGFHTFSLGPTARQDPRNSPRQIILGEGGEPKLYHRFCGAFCFGHECLATNKIVFFFLILVDLFL